jgi:hypothetical protein
VSADIVLEIVGDQIDILAAAQVSGSVVVVAALLDVLPLKKGGILI